MSKLREMMKKAGYAVGEESICEPVKEVVAEVVVAAPVVVVAAVEVKRGRGRPKKEVTLSDAERSKRWRDKRKLSKSSK